MTQDTLRKFVSAAPFSPGIYRFKSGGKKDLYIGKASNLKSRLRSYLQNPDSRIRKMVADAGSVKYVPTLSDIEALIIESQYIKKHKPTFNIMLRDDKQYGFVGFTKEEFPKIFITHQPTKFRNSNIEVRNKFQSFKFPNSPSGMSRHRRDSLKHWDLDIVSDLGFRASDFYYVGPFTDIGALKITLKYLRRIFPYCTCKKPHNNFCLNYHIGKCLGFCCLKQQNRNKGQETRDKLTYAKNIKAIKDILNGKRVSLIKNLEKEMVTLGKKERFEKAIELREQIEKIKRVFENVLVIRNLDLFRNSKLEIRNLGVEDNNKTLLLDLKRLLKLDRLPIRIESYDMANIQGKYAVGAMAVFVNGKPDKHEYRKFKIRNSNIETRNKLEILNSKFKTVSDFGSGGDVGMLKEVLSRRFRHPEWPLPDLIMVDGGKAQLNAVKTAYRGSTSIDSIDSIDCGIVALTKNEKHKGEKIYVAKPSKGGSASGGKNPVSLSKLPTDVKNLLLHINSEAHRFAVSYYRKLHRKFVKQKTKTA